ARTAPGTVLGHRIKRNYWVEGTITEMDRPTLIPIYQTKKDYRRFSDPVIQSRYFIISRGHEKGGNILKISDSSHWTSLW
ncbi:unnamed protein product, partial [Tenebrio molitor]